MKKKRLCTEVEEGIYYDLEDVCKLVSRQRGTRCTKREIVSLAITAFVMSFKANINTKDTEEKGE